MPWARRPVDMIHRRTCVTGSACILELHTSQKPLARGDELLGIDSLNDCYVEGLTRSCRRREMGT
jgi:hypothetical protein